MYSARREAEHRYRVKEYDRWCDDGGPDSPAWVKWPFRLRGAPIVDMPLCEYELRSPAARARYLDRAAGHWLERMLSEADREYERLIAAGVLTYP